MKKQYIVGAVIAIALGSSFLSSGDLLQGRLSGTYTQVNTGTTSISSQRWGWEFYNNRKSPQFVSSPFQVSSTTLSCRDNEIVTNINAESKLIDFKNTLTNLQIHCSVVGESNIHETSVSSTHNLFGSIQSSGASVTSDPAAIFPSIAFKYDNTSSGLKRFKYIDPSSEKITYNANTSDFTRNSTVRVSIPGLTAPNDGIPGSLRCNSDTPELLGVISGIGAEYITTPAGKQIVGLGITCRTLHRFQM